jgi:hypothetical protein
MARSISYNDNMREKSLKADILFFCTITFGMPSWFNTIQINPSNLDTTVKVVTGVVAIIAGFFASRYHYYATKEKKERLKRLKEGKNVEDD